MKRKTKIIWFYLIVATFSFVVIFGMKLLGQLSREQAQVRYQGFTQAEFEERAQKEREKFKNYGIKEDLMVTLQDGKVVNLKEALKEKVTVFAQFFSG